jgi:hypothetical protein
MPEMAVQLRRAARASGDVLPGPGALVRYIRRWEEGHCGVSERYRLHYCKALGIEPDDFGPGRPPRSQPGGPGGLVSGLAAAPAAPGGPAALAGPPVPCVTPGQVVAAGPVPGALVPWLGPGGAGVADAGVSGSGDIPYRWVQMPDMGGSWIEREVSMTAREGREHAERAEPREIGDATLEQLRAEVIRLAHDYEVGETLPVFWEMRAVRSAGAD